MLLSTKGPIRGLDCLTFCDTGAYWCRNETDWSAGEESYT